MRWTLLVLAGCRIGFHDSASTVLDAGTDAARDAELDAAPGTRIMTFGERTTSMVKNVTSDATIIEGAPEALNFGAGLDMSVYGNVERGLLRFDLGSLTSTDVVLEATLELHFEDSNDQVAGLYQVMRLDESWTEGDGDGELAPGASWVSRDGTTDWSSRGGTATLNLAIESFGAIQGPVSIPLPASSVQAWIDAPATNHGMLMLSADGGHWHPTSRDNSATEDRPQLRLVLQDP